MGWPVVALGEVAKPIKRLTVVEPGKIYRLLGMRSQIGGPFLRETKDGAGIAAAVLNKTKTGDFIYSRLFAWQGSFGVISEAFDECYVSNEFPLFRIDAPRLDSRFLAFWFGLPWVQKVVEGDCFGSTPGTRNRYKEEYFLRLEAPVPPLDEQLRIVAKLDKVAALVREAEAIKANIRREVQALLRALVQGAPERPHPTIPFGEVALQRPVDIEVEPEAEYQFAGVYSFGRGVFRSAAKSGSEISYKKLIRLDRNDFTYPKLMAWEGALGVVSEECVGCYVSPEFPVFRINQEILHPAVVDAYFKDALVWPSLVGTSKGTNARRRRLHPDTIRAHHIPIPPKGVQQKIRDIVERLNLHPDRKEQSQLDTLLPALLHRVFNNETDI